MALIACRECGARVSDTAKACPHCGAPVAKRAGLLKKGLIVFGCLVVGVWALGLVLQTRKPVSDTSSASESSQAASVPNAAQIQAAAPPVMTSTQAESAFVAAVEKARADYRVAQTDFQKGATRPERAQGICQAVPNGQATGWVGKVVNLSTNGEGKGVLSVAVADGVILRTNSSSFLDENTLIEPGTRVFEAMKTLKVGDAVRFDGSFFRGSTDCFSEMSLTLDGSIRSPEFRFRFTSVSK